MIHSEHLEKADRNYEIRHDGNHAIHVYYKDGEAIVFPSLIQLIEYIYLGGVNVERFYVNKKDLMDLYEHESYDYYELKKYAKKFL